VLLVIHARALAALRQKTWTRATPAGPIRGGFCPLLGRLC
jgi:hypothetical protein